MPRLSIEGSCLVLGSLPRSFVFASAATVEARAREQKRRSAGARTYPAFGTWGADRKFAVREGALS
jgi:hypothetical protein